MTFLVVLTYGPRGLRAPGTKSAQAGFWPVRARPAFRILTWLDNFDPVFFGPARLDPLVLARASQVDP